MSVSRMEHVLVLCDDIERARLERNGVPAVLNAVPGGGPRQVFVQDPGGVRIEINFSPETNGR